MTRKYKKIYRLEEAKVAGPSGQRISTGPVGRSLFCLTGPTVNILATGQLMKFPDKTLKFNFNHSPKAINSLITRVYLDLLPHIKRILTEISAGNQYFIIQ
jgi:hypothetical protein